MTGTTPDDGFDTVGTDGTTPDVEITTDPDVPADTDPEVAQFPALIGKPDVEIAARSADVEDHESTRHVKIFVLAPGIFDGRRFDHDANFAATRQYMISQGLRPVGDVVFNGKSVNVDGVSINLVYSVEATPAVVATDPEVAHAEVVQE